MLQLGLLIYQLTTGCYPLQNLFPLSFLISSKLNNHNNFNIEAQLRIDNFVRQQQGKPNLPIPGCKRQCLQTIMNKCLSPNMAERANLMTVGHHLCLCIGLAEWAPFRMAVSVECLHCAGDPTLVYWASGSRGLIVGQFDVPTGKLDRKIILEAPVPTSGMYAHRKGKPVPLAVGHATCLTVVKATNQLWVGTENGAKGSLHVFTIPGMTGHHSVHLQDAVLSILAINNCPMHGDNPFLKYRVFVGLANGTIVVFTGIQKDQVAEMPLQGVRKVIATKNQGPCLGMAMDSAGLVWYSQGDSLEAFDPLTLEPNQKLSRMQMISTAMTFHVDSQVSSLVSPATWRTQADETNGNWLKPLSRSNSLRENRDTLYPKGTVSSQCKPRPAIIVQLTGNQNGMWGFARRSTTIGHWDRETGECRLCYDVR